MKDKKPIVIVGILAAAAMMLSANEFENSLSQLVWNMDEPVADGAAIPLFFIARLARAHITVAQSGEGADELLGGYTIYQKMLWLSRLQSMSGSAQAGKFALALARVSGSPRLLKYATAFSQPLDKRYRGVSMLFSDDLRHHLYGDSLSGHNGVPAYVDETFNRYYLEANGNSDLNRMLYIDLKTWLADDLLVKADKMTMAASLELRVPFLDHTVVEFAARLPAKYKIRNGTSKFLLKKVAESLLPSDIVHQPKRGFPVPIADWLRGPLFDRTRDRLLDQRSATGQYFKREVVHELLERHRRGEDLADELWALLVFEEWHSAFIDRPVVEA